MPEPISLISPEKINSEEFRDFLLQNGVLLNPDSIYDGRLDYKNCHVWMVLNNEELENFDPSEIDVIGQKLKNQPQTHILLDVSLTQGSKKLALEFAQKFAQKWECIIYESEDKIYFPEEYDRELKVESRLG